MRTPSMSTETGRTTHVGVAAAVGIVASLGLAGCSSAAEEDWDAIAVGEDAVIGSVELRSFLLVAREDGQPGRLLGTLNNESAEAVEVTISDDDDEIILTVPADSQYPLDTNEVVFDTVGDAPGARTSIVATTTEGSEDLSIPVVDGTLERYEPYLPGEEASGGRPAPGPPSSRVG